MMWFSFLFSPSMHSPFPLCLVGLLILVVLTLPLRYCTLSACESFIHVDFYSLFVCYSCGAHKFSFRWNKDLTWLTMVD